MSILDVGLRSLHGHQKGFVFLGLLRLKRLGFLHQAGIQHLAFADLEASHVDKGVEPIKLRMDWLPPSRSRGTAMDLGFANRSLLA